MLKACSLLPQAQAASDGQQGEGLLEGLDGHAEQQQRRTGGDVAAPAAAGPCGPGSSHGGNGPQGQDGGSGSTAESTLQSVGSSGAAGGEGVRGHGSCGPSTSSHGPGPDSRVVEYVLGRAGDVGAARDVARELFMALRLVS